MTVLVYTRKTPRTEYIFENILADHLGVPVTISEEQKVVPFHQGPSITYGDARIGESLHVSSHELMFMGDINIVNIESAANQFPFAADVGDFKFDPFASSFLLLSRYEEYLGERRDSHGRFAAEHSFQSTEDIRTPWVDKWMLSIKEELSVRFNVNFPSREPIKELSFDLDNAYAYKGKGLGRNIGGFCRDLITGKFGLIGARFRAILGGRDPYDTYDQIADIKSKFEGGIRFFLPVAKRGSFDKNLPAKSGVYQSLAERLKSIGSIGIHPGYQSGTIDQLENEVASYRTLTNQKPQVSRQHYLRLNLPTTYDLLNTVGIYHDYSMGYADAPGFRAGTSRSFKFFDLSRNEISDTTVTPFTYMDGTFHDYMKCSTDKANEIIDELVANTQNVQGDFHAIWHNDSLLWEGWESVMDHTVNKVNGY